MRRYLTLGWILAAIVTLLPIGYFILRVGHQDFRDAALGNLFATILGIIVGVPIAVEVNRRQEEERTRRNQSRQVSAERLRSRALYHRLREELIHNGHTLDRIRDAMAESPHSRTDHWQWILAITEGFKVDAYADLIAHAPEPAFPWDLDDALRLAFSMLTGVSSRAREAAAAHAFYYGYRADSDSANKYLGYVRDLAREGNRRVEEAIELFNRYRDLFPRPETNE